MALATEFDCPRGRLVGSKVSLRESGTTRGGAEIGPTCEQEPWPAAATRFNRAVLRAMCTAIRKVWLAMPPLAPASDFRCSTARAQFRPQ